MNTVVRQHIVFSFVREGFKGFFHPGFAKFLDLPSEANRSFSREDVDEFAQRPNSYLYIGAAIELCVATILFFLMFGLTIAVQSLMVVAASRYGNIEKWDGFIDLVVGGINFVALGLLAAFALRVLHVLLTKVLKV